MDAPRHKWLPGRFDVTGGTENHVTHATAGYRAPRKRWRGPSLGSRISVVGTAAQGIIWSQRIPVLPVYMRDRPTAIVLHMKRSTAIIRRTPLVRCSALARRRAPIRHVSERNAALNNAANTARRLVRERDGCCILCAMFRHFQPIMRIENHLQR
jgi:hypothetical protein